MNTNLEDQAAGGVVQEWMGWFRACPALFPLLAGALLASMGAAVASHLSDEARGVCALIVGILLGVACNFSIRDWVNGLHPKVVAIGVLLVVGIIQAASSLWILPNSTDPAHNWDSLQRLGLVLAAVAVVGAILILLPLVLRKIAFVCILSFHFAGIMSAVTSVDPPGTHAPWISTYMWVKVFRPYLHFLYMNNAYHFYSPEPGPATLVWYRIDYSDGKSRWVRVPNRDASPVPLLYQRTVSVCDATNMSSGYTPGDYYSNLLPKRTAAGLENQPQIPPLPSDIQAAYAYREPAPNVKKILASYVRHVAKTYPRPGDNPSATISKIRVYRLTHVIITPKEMSGGLDPNDPATYVPYFYGDYDTEGNLKDDKDGFLYFALPIYNEKELRKRNPDGYLPSCLDYFVLHSGLDLSKEKK
jgi:hypothetical protein